MASYVGAAIYARRTGRQVTVNWVDLAVLAVLGVSAVLAFARGLVREVLGIGSWAGAAYFAAWAFPFIRDRFRGWIGRPDISDAMAVASAFLVAVIVLSVIAGMIGSLVRMSLFGGVDRTLGMVFGLVRGAALVAFAYVAVGFAVPVPNWPLAVQDARSLPYVRRAALLAVGLLPAEYRPAVQDLPIGKDTNAEDLLHATPLGKALQPAKPAPAVHP